MNSFTTGLWSKIKLFKARNGELSLSDRMGSISDPTSHVITTVPTLSWCQSSQDSMLVSMRACSVATCFIYVHRKSQYDFKRRKVYIIWRETRVISCIIFVYHKDITLVWIFSWPLKNATKPFIACKLYKNPRSLLDLTLGSNLLKPDVKRKSWASGKIEAQGIIDAALKLE